MAAVVLESAASASSLSHGSSSSPSSSSLTRNIAIASITPGLPRPYSNRLAIPKCQGFRRAPKPSSSSSSASGSPRRAYQGIVCEQPKETLAPAAGAVSDKTWKELVLDSDIPVLVDFWAPWCGPCRMIAPLVDQLAVQYAGRVRCLKINTDESPNTATEYGVRSIPTVMIFREGAKKETIIGAVPMEALVNAIEKCL